MTEAHLRRISPKKLRRTMGGAPGGFLIAAVVGGILLACPAAARAADRPVCIVGSDPGAANFHFREWISPSNRGIKQLDHAGNCTSLGVAQLDTAAVQSQEYFMTLESLRSEEHTSELQSPC